MIRLRRLWASRGIRVGRSIPRAETKFQASLYIGLLRGGKKEDVAPNESASITFLQEIRSKRIATYYRGRRPAVGKSSRRSL